MHEFASAIASWNVAVARDGRRLDIVIRSKDTPNADYALLSVPGFGVRG
jgi:hypothetical protein